MHVNVDSLLVDKMVNEVKSAGVFDQFRKDSMADVDTKPAYQNLRQRVELTVSKFLAEQTWRQDLNKNQLREKLRKHITEAGFLDTGVERIVDQVVNPKISTFFQPKIEDIAYKYLGIEKPHSSPPRPQSCNGSLDIKVDFLPTDLEAVSPDSEKANPKSEIKENIFNDSTEDKNEEFESPPFEPIEGRVPSPVKKEDSNHSHLSGISGLTSQDSVSSEHKETTPPLHKFTVSADTQPESELSEVSSNSRLSIVTNEESSSKPAASEPVDNVGISEEAQMPKFNDSYSSGESKVVHNLHFDIKREDIKFEGTDRNADKHLYESDHSNENNLKTEEIKSNEHYVIKSEFQIKPEIVNDEFKIEPTIKAEEALGESISTKASSSFEENNESTAVDMDLGESDTSQSTNSSGMKYNDNATEMKSEGRTNGDSGPRPPSPPPPNDYFLTKPPSPPSLETNAPLEPPSLTLADLYRIPPTHLKEYLPPRPPSPLNEYLPPRPPSPVNKYLQPRPPTPPYEQMNYLAPAIVNPPKPPSPINSDLTLKPPSPPSPPKQQEEDCKLSLYIPNSHKDINFAESEISQHATLPKAPSTPPLPKSTKDTIFTESETSQSTNSSESKNKESSPILKSDESTKIADIQPPKPPSTPPLPSKSSSRNESRSKSSSHHHHHHKSKSSRDSSRSSNGNNLHRSSSSSSRNHSSPSASSRTDDKKRSSSSNRHKSSKSDKDKDKSRDKKKDDHTSARHKERRRKSTDSNDGDSHRQSSRNNSHHGDERSNTLKETPTNSNSSGMSSNTNSNSGTSCNDTSQKRSTSGSFRKTKSSYRSPNREESFKYFTIERTEKEAVQRLLGKLKDVIKRNQPPIYLLDCGHDTRKSFENLSSKVIAIDATKYDNLASPKKGPIVIAMDSEMKQTESLEFSIKPHDKSMPVDKESSKNNPGRTKSRKRKPDESYTVSYHMFTGNGSEKDLIIDCLEYNKANKMFRPNNDRIEVSPTSSELSVSSKENEFTDKTKNSSPENSKNGKHIKAEGIVRIEKPSNNGFKVSSQRYSSEDLYKPRPLSQRPRRREMMETEII